MNFLTAIISLRTAATISRLSLSRTKQCLKKEQSTRLLLGHVAKMSPDQIVACLVEAQKRIGYRLELPYFGYGWRSVPMISVDTPQFRKSESWFYSGSISELRVTLGTMWRQLQHTSLITLNADSSQSAKRIYLDGHAESEDTNAKGVTG